MTARKRGPGQPPLGKGPARHLSLKIAPEMYTRITKAADREASSVSDWARGALELALARGSTR